MVYLPLVLLEIIKPNSRNWAVQERKERSVGGGGLSLARMGL
jgi:hypothetical protein